MRIRTAIALIAGALTLGLLIAAQGPHTVSTVSAVPDGPSVPSGGWSVEYGDAFKEPVCGSQGTVAGSSACDNTWFPNGDTHGCSPTQAFNPNELEDFSCAAVRVDSEGLELSCTPKSGLPAASGFATPRYLCGQIEDQDPSVPSGYKFFTWKPGQRQEWAVQIVAQFPQNTGEADPAWWSSDWPHSEEIDFFEGFGSDAGPGGNWTHATSGNGWIGAADPTWIFNTSNQHSPARIAGESDFYKDDGFDPSAGFHTYTSVFYPDNSMSEFVDGRPQVWSWVPLGPSRLHYRRTVIGPPGPISNATLGFILSYAMRDSADGDPDRYFKSGTRTFRIRSVAVYENKTADGANAFNPGLAPGTTVAGR